MSTHKHTWKFYVLIGLVSFVALYGADLVVEHAVDGYPKPTIWSCIAEAAVFAAIWWLVEEKPFKKNK